MTWDPFGTIADTLWLGGGQWAGKSTVARILARRCGITAYHYDYHDARGHDARRVADRAARGEPLTGPGPDEVWVRRTSAEMARDALEEFGRRFEWTLDDLRGLVSGRPILAEGWGLRPELVAPLLDSPGRMLVMVPTEEFRQRQLRELPRAREFGPRSVIPNVRRPTGSTGTGCSRCRPPRPPGSTGSACWLWTEAGTPNRWPTKWPTTSRPTWPT